MATMLLTLIGFYTHKLVHNVNKTVCFVTFCSYLKQPLIIYVVGVRNLIYYVVSPVPMPFPFPGRFTYCDNHKLDSGNYQ